MKKKLLCSSVTSAMVPHEDGSLVEVKQVRLETWPPSSSKETLVLTIAGEELKEFETGEHYDIEIKMPVKLEIV